MIVVVLILNGNKLRKYLNLGGKNEETPIFSDEFDFHISVYWL